MVDKSQALQVADDLMENASMDSAEGCNPDVVELEELAAKTITELCEQLELTKLMVKEAAKIAEIKAWNAAIDAAATKAERGELDVKAITCANQIRALKKGGA